MSYDALLSKLGFNSDPFAKTNSDEEERLEDYFIAPPFFNAVYGDSKTPKSSFVFAPRGYGKTALKRKIEIASADDNFLCITYNFFPVTGKKLSDIDQEYHLNNIIRLNLLAILTAFKNNKNSNLVFTKDEKHILYMFIKKYLSNMDRSDLKSAIKAIKNFNEAAIEVWNTFTGPIGFVLNNFFEYIGLEKADIVKYEKSGGTLGHQFEQLELLKQLSEKLGYNSTYILVDKVDENNLTNIASNTYDFIAPLINDLQVLEFEGYAFKFFLWDAILPSYRAIARPDRIKYYELKWTPEQLTKMLTERLKAYSDNKILSLQELFEIEDFDLDKLLVNISQGSPRTLIRICKEIIDQQSQIDDFTKSISKIAVDKGINEISRNITQERYTENVIRDLTKSARCDFTIRYIYNDVFKFTQQAGMAKVTTLVDCGAIKQVGTIQETKGAKFSNHYCVADILLAKAIFPNMSIYQFAQDKLYENDCGHLLLRDWDSKNNHICEFCQKEAIRS